VRRNVRPLGEPKVTSRARRKSERSAKLSVLLSEVADYELRRELLRIDSRRSLAQALAEDAVIVTPNTRHFDSMVRAVTWQEV